MTEDYEVFARRIHRLYKQIIITKPAYRQTTTKMPFTVLSNATVRSLLHSLDRPALLNLQTRLNSALSAISTGGEAQYQPHRAGVTRPEGQTTLFMPLTDPGHVGAKIIGVPPPFDAHDAAQEDGRQRGLVGSELKGVLVICDATGRAAGVLNAGELTAFRTALAATTLFARRSAVRNVVIFGAGKQALWHARIALLLKGKAVASLAVVNRAGPRRDTLIQTLRSEAAEKDWQVKFRGVDPGDKAELEKTVKAADAVFCTTPSREVLFPAAWLKKEVYVSAIGSYKTSMLELDPELLKSIVASSDGYNPRKDAKGGVIVVDSREACFAESGEIVRAALTAEEMVEIGEVLDGEEKKRLEKWLQRGQVVYKSVGVGVMDLAMGNAVLEIAREKGFGVTVDEL
ncbi:uncharacterized protein K452DRAFT_110423 [Aplosporella prunicola CBS 121167]|uniref:Quinate/shikimate 5-dehydrogenase/glutamyl-tRNA reductase domain-containing protein n=1 Tax=Aplosporella prunicola CBS 121167 TaxID=1176127 RepID=A0A6A6B1Y6_9PEZI|nr:uncharacterized protein K452DRAFT_110423 [Aplosporella prunicola CBS 121167]KAF2137383.1 hypothetical protein K452DRAFT_110423 [Aplosporella prunicola CBS 121167]